jgi:chromosome segregation ATPase
LSEREVRSKLEAESNL